MKSCSKGVYNPVGQDKNERSKTLANKMFYDGLARKGTSEKVTPVMKKGTSHVKVKRQNSTEQILPEHNVQRGGEREEQTLLVSSSSVSSSLT